MSCSINELNSHIKILLSNLTWKKIFFAPGNGDPVPGYLIHKIYKRFKFTKKRNMNPYYQ